MGLITKSCKSCGRNFTMNERERDFYASHNLEQPVRCKSCRAIRKGIRDKKVNG
jgi:predicted RNA-binding Zn-ribbon protein involved in translation (DUF1610 family)